MRKKLHFLLLLIACSGGHAFSMPSCPGSITTSQHIVAQPEGWATFLYPSHYYLSGITFYSGPPQQGASLSPDHSKRLYTTWQFNRSEKIYLACRYNDTSIQLVQRVPPHLHTCTVRYQAHILNQQGENIPIELHCR